MFSERVHEAVDCRPVIERNDTNGYSKAEVARDRIFNAIERAASSRQTQLLLLKSPPYASPPWVLAECWVRNSNDRSATLRSSAKIFVRPREFHRYPLEFDIELKDDKSTTKWSSIIDFDDSDAAEILKYLLFERTSRRFDFQRCRTFPMQFWRPANRPTRLGSDRRAALATTLMIIGSATIPLGIGLFLIAAGAYMTHVNNKRRRVVLSSGRPEQEPRSLIRLDSWQALVRGLGPAVESLKGGFSAELKRGSDQTLSVTHENIWYWGVDGKVEREQLVIRFRRAMAFVHLYQYEQDLFVGWDAHLNGGSWAEHVAGQGFDKQTRRLCSLHTIQASWHVPSEYDITDANCLIERVHAAIVSTVRLAVAEHNIDQEIDFTILREKRAGVVGMQENPAAPAQGRGVLSRFTRVQ